MPIIDVQMLQGRTANEKSQFIKAMSQVTVAPLGAPEAAIRIVRTEVAPEHGGVGSKTIAQLRRSRPSDARAAFAGADEAPPARSQQP
jgi:4-oxalocrotonate tautomerase